MHCAACGCAHSDATTSVCSRCGAPLARACPACGQTVAADARYCSACGGLLPARPAIPAAATGPAPLEYTPAHLAERILDAQAALAEVEKESFEPFRLFGEAMAYHSLGDNAKSDAVLAQIIAKYDKDAAYNIAYVEAWRGNIDQAFAWLDKAVEYKDSALPMIAIEPLFKPLHGDPRWAALLKRLGRSPEQLAAIPFEVKLPASGPAAAATR